MVSILCFRIADSAIGLVLQIELSPSPTRAWLGSLVDMTNQNFLVQFVLGISKFLNPRAGAINRFHEIFD
jgi:hypothetical protein